MIGDSENPLRTALSALLAAALTVSLSPVAAFADDDSGMQGAAAQTESQTAGGPAEDDSPSGSAVDGELIVTYGKDASAAGIARQADVDVASTEKLLEDADGSDVSLVTLGEGQDAEEARAALADDPRVESVEPNVRFHLLASVNDAKVVAYPTYNYYLDSEQIEAAWDGSKTQGAVTVAVLDTGVTMLADERDPDLADTVDYDHAYDASGRGKPLSSSYEDTIGHGTAVSELIAAKANNGEGIAGTSYDAKVLPVRVLDDSGETSTAQILLAYGYVLSVADELNVKVVNMSLGGEAAGSEVTVMQKAVTAAREAGILTVAAAGNEGSASDGNPVEYPAALDDVVAVGAVDSAGKVASWSEHHSYVDLAAAGVDLCVPAFFSETSGGFPRTGSAPWMPGRPGGWWSSVTYTADAYDVESGTSYAAPIVSGVAALLFASDASATPAEVENTLEYGAKDRGTSGKDDYYGYGELDASAALKALPGAGARIALEQARVKAGKAAAAKFKAAKPKITSKKRAKRSIKVKWKKVSGAQGYRVYYRVKGKKTWKKATLTKKSKRLKKLKRKTKYQIRVRAYMKAWNGSTVWSKYSKTVTVKTK